MCNRTRKLKISFNESNEKVVLQNLGQDVEKKGDDVKTLEIEVPDTKDTYEYLCRAKEVLDWEFLDEKITVSEESKIPEEKTVNKDTGTFRSTALSWEDERTVIVQLLKQSFFKKSLVTSPEILTLISVILETKKKSPSFRLTHKLIERLTDRYYEKLGEKIDPDDVPILYFLDGYNSIVAGSILTDLMESIHRVWNLVEPSWTLLNFIEAIYNTKLGTGTIKLG